MNRRIASGVALASAVAIGFTGCSSSNDTGSPTKAPPTATPGPTMSPLTKWAAKMCVAAQGATLAAPPAVTLTDVNGYIKAVPAWLADGAAKMHRAADALRQLPPAPGGVAADHLTVAIASVDTYAARLTEAQTEISSVKAGDTAGLKATTAHLSVIFGQAAQTTPVQELSKNADMKQAIDAAATCTPIRNTPAGAPPS